MSTPVNTPVNTPASAPVNSPVHTFVNMLVNTVDTHVKRRLGVSRSGKSFRFVGRARTHRMPSEIRAPSRFRAPSPFSFGPGMSPVLLAGSTVTSSEF